MSDLNQLLRTHTLVSSGWRVRRIAGERGWYAHPTAKPDGGQWFDRLGDALVHVRTETAIYGRAA